MAYRLIARWLDAFTYGRRNVDPGRQAVAGQWVSGVDNAVAHLRARGMARA